MVAAGSGARAVTEARRGAFDVAAALRVVAAAEVGAAAGTVGFEVATVVGAGGSVGGEVCCAVGSELVCCESTVTVVPTIAGGPTTDNTTGPSSASTTGTPRAPYRIAWRWYMRPSWQCRGAPGQSTPRPTSQVCDATAGLSPDPLPSQQVQTAAQELRVTTIAHRSSRPRLAAPSGTAARWPRATSARRVISARARSTAG